MVLVRGLSFYEIEISGNCYSKADLWDLYARRWDIETTYYRVKTLFKVESFHSKKMNGVLQEIWSAVLVLAMNSYLILQSWNQKMKGILKNKKSPSFKNTTAVFQRYFVKLLFPSKANQQSALLEIIKPPVSA